MADTCECHDWKAWHDRMPGSTPTLHVTGSCTCPREGFTIRLEKQEPQGINPKDLLLRLEISEGEGGYGGYGGGGTEQQVEFEEQTDFEYETVTILPDGGTVKVEQTS